MRASIVSIALLFVAMPAFAADPNLPATPPAPPAPPAATYEVWAFKLTGGQWVRQPNYNFTTTDLRQAADYKAQINSFAGWTVTTNLPDASYVHTVYNDPIVSSLRPTQSPQSPAFSVWAYKLTGGKWVKNDRFSWTTADPSLGLKYAKSVDAVAGWTTTTNCPPTVPKAKHYVNGGTVRGAENYAMRINVGGYSFAIPYSAIQNADSDSGDSDSSFYDNFTNNNDTSVQDTIASEDMINQQS